MCEYLSSAVYKYSHSALSNASYVYYSVAHSPLFMSLNILYVSRVAITLHGSWSLLWPPNAHNLTPNSDPAAVETMKQETVKRPGVSVVRVLMAEPFSRVRFSTRPPEHPGSLISPEVTEALEHVFRFSDTEPWTSSSRAADLNLFSLAKIKKFPVVMWTMEVWGLATLSSQQHNNNLFRPPSSNVKKKTFWEN